MRLLTSLFLVATSMLCATASAKTITCSGCGTMTKRSLAVSAGVGTHFIVNMSDGSIAKWKIEQDCSGSICILATTSLPVDAVVTNYIAFYRTNNGKVVVLPPNHTYPDNAYEAVRFPQLSTNVGQYIKDSGVGFTQDLLTYTSSLGGVFGFSMGPVEITVRVVYSDSSSSLYIYNHVTQKWDRVKGEARDSNNNQIPESADTVTGGPGTTVIYNFSGNPNNLIDFVYQLSLLGVPITGPTGNRTGIVCVSDSSGTVCYGSP